MSALAKLYASRGIHPEGNDPSERGNVAPTVSLDPMATLVLRRKFELEKSVNASEVSQRKVIADIPDYESALGVLEQVNSGFADVFGRLQKSEEIKQQLVEECSNLDKNVQSLEAELEALKRRLEEAEIQTSEIAERLMSETARASNLEHRSKQTEQALAEAQRRSEDLENVCKTLHDGIYSVFGAGSPTQKALGTLARS